MASPSGENDSALLDNTEIEGDNVDSDIDGEYSDAESMPFSGSEASDEEISSEGEDSIFYAEQQQTVPHPASSEGEDSIFYAEQQQTVPHPASSDDEQQPPSPPAAKKRYVRKKNQTFPDGFDPEYWEYKGEVNVDTDPMELLSDFDISLVGIMVE